MDCSPPDSSVHEILQARIPEWIVMSSSRGSSHPRIESESLALAGGFFTTKSLGKLQLYVSMYLFSHACFLNVKISKCNLKAQFFLKMGTFI